MKSLSRRQFLQMGAVGAAGVLFIDGLGKVLDASQAEQWAPRLASLGEPVPTTCGLCPAKCGLLCYLDGDRLVGIFGNPEHPFNRGKLCARGIAGLNLVLDPERILYPLRRAGKRGHGQWQRITWDEAYHMISSNLSSLQKENRIGEAVFDVREEELLMRPFFDALGEVTVLDRSVSNRLNRRAAHMVTWGTEYMMVDPDHSTCILNFGSNPAEHHDLQIGLVQRLIEARVGRGMKLVTFDVRHSNTAAISDEAYMIKPGTDGLVALALAHVIMNEGLHDAPFLEHWTNFPLQRLKSHLAPYPPERAASASGLPAADIRRIARVFAASRPGAILSGGGVSEHENGLQNERSVLLLAAVTGNVDNQGGCGLPGTMSIHEMPSDGTRRREKAPLFSQPSSFLSLMGKNDGIQFYMTCFSNPVYDDPESMKAAEILKDTNRVPFFVALDAHLTESAALADLVLPAATFLESWDLDLREGFDRAPVLSLRQPVVQRVAETEFLKAGEKMSSPPVRPRGEAVALNDFFLEVGRRLGGPMETHFPFGSTAEYVGRLAAPHGSLRTLKRQGILSGVPRVYRSYEQKGFDTPSGKCEVYSETLENQGYSPLPVFMETPIHRQPLDGGRMILTTFTPAVHTHRTGNCKWLAEIFHDNPAWMNTATAASLGLREGDRVRITSAVGSIETRLHLTEGIHPRTIAIAQGCGHREWGTIARAEKMRSSDPDANLLWWSKQGNGVHPNTILPVLTDPRGGGQAWHETLVDIEKA